MKWEKGKIASLCDRVISGGTPKSDEASYYADGTIPWLRTQEVQFNRIYDTEIKITENGLNNSNAKWIKENSVIVAMYGNSAGRTAINKIPLTTNQACCNLEINSLKADYNFVYYKLLSEFEALKGLSKGAAQNNLNANDVKEFPVTIPPLPTQRKIASILSAYDDLIENNLKRIKLLEEKAKLHYKELMQEISYSKTIREEYIKDCLAFYIGGGWGEEDYKEGFAEPAFVIRGTDIPDAKKGEVKGVPFRYHKESNLASRNMQAGDIVFEVSGGSKGQPVGRSILITEKMLQQFGKPVMCASFCKMLRPNENITPEFFYLYLLVSHENGVIAQYEKHSASNIVNYGFEEFIGEQKIIIPKETDLKAFTEKVKPIFTLISTLGEQNSKLRGARDILLPKLMNGQIEV